MSVRVRRAEPEDVDFLLELANHDDVEPYMGARRARDRDSLLAEIERSRREPGQFGRFVIEVDDGGGPCRAGTMGFEAANRRSRIAHLEGLAVHPDFRGRRVADDAARELQHHLIGELGYHRLQLECYGFNERAIRHAERAGFVREGVKRKAYWRHGEWVDAIMFALIREDLPEVRGPGTRLLEDHVARFNAGVASGEASAMLERFADESELAFEGVPVGPFRGREAIAAAYRERPPDDEILVLGARENGAEVVADYAWAREPDLRAGELRLTRAGERIVRLVVTFEE